MQIQKIKLALLMVLFTTLAFRCEKVETCEDTVCTTDFKSIVLKIEDVSGGMIAIEKVETWVNGSLTSTSKPGENIDPLLYTIADDSYLTSQGTNTSIDAQVKIYKAGAVVKTLDYKYQTDCCHINKVSGVDSVIIP